MVYILADQEVENGLGMDQGHKSQGALLSSLCQLAKLCVFKVLQTPKLVTKSSNPERIGDISHSNHTY